ncbi:MAG: hypothetical protein A4E69_00545 [Syntrophus sp. PtaB.Bin138]|nr:MAG: hypothetical protein A4E69_00545 [Syntrophus sp. PtaB.Bin138]
MDPSLEKKTGGRRTIKTQGGTPYDELIATALLQQAVPHAIQALVETSIRGLNILQIRKMLREFFCHKRETLFYR